MHRITIGEFQTILFKTAGIEDYDKVIVKPHEKSFYDLLGWDKSFTDKGVFREGTFQNVLPKLEQYIWSIDESKRNQIVEGLINAVLEREDPRYKLEYSILIESLINGCFFSTFYHSYIFEGKGKSDTIFYDVFFQSVLSIILDEPNEFRNMPKREKKYNQLISSMVKAYEQKTKENRMNSDRTINLFLSYVHDPYVADMLLFYYSQGSDGIRQFFDLWYQNVVFQETTIGKDLWTSSSEGSSRLNSLNKHYVEYCKKIEIVELIDLLSSDNTLYQLLDLDAFNADSFLPSGAWMIEKGKSEEQSIAFKTFYSILSACIPGFEYEIKNDKIDGLVWDTFRHYLSNRSESKADMSICEAFRDYLKEKDSQFIAESIINAVSEKYSKRLAMILRQSYYNNKKDGNVQDFYTLLLGNVRTFSRLRNLEPIRYDERIVSDRLLDDGERLLNTLYEIVKYRDKSFSTKLFNDEMHDSLLNRDSFQSLCGLLAEYFSHPRIIFNQKIYEIGYWYTEILDRKLLGRNSEMYQRVPEITMTLFWNKLLSIGNKEVTKNDVQVLNGLGYSLSLTTTSATDSSKVSDSLTEKTEVNQEYLNLGYRIMSTARDFLYSIHDSLDATTWRHLNALSYSNLSTHFIQLAFMFDRSDMKRKSLEIANAYANETLAIRKTLLQETGEHRFKPLVALSHMNYGTSLYYKGLLNYDKSQDASQDISKRDFIGSIQHNMESFLMYEKLNDKTDQKLRAARKVLGTANNLKEFFGKFTLDYLDCNIEEEPLAKTDVLIHFLDEHKSKESAITSLLKNCISTVEDLDHDSIEEVASYNELLSEIEADL